MKARIPAQRRANLNIYDAGFAARLIEVFQDDRQRWAVELPPVLGITAAVIFGLLFGIAGVIFATPLMVVAMVLVQKLYIEELLESGSQSP